jgi:hypothetical protein
MNKLIKIVSVPFLILPSLLMADDSEVDRFTHELYSLEEVKEETETSNMDTIIKEIEENPTAAGKTAEEGDIFHNIYGVNVDDAS